MTSAVQPTPYEQLLAVQDRDVTLMQLRHRLDNHPLRVDLDALRAERAEIESRRAEVEARRHDLNRELKRLSDDATTLEDKRAKTEAKLYDGSVTATKELLALQEESASLLARQQRIEDDELEIMETLESVDAELDVVSAEIAETVARSTAVEADLASAVSAIEAELAEVETARREAASQVPDELLVRYQELAPHYDGAPLARFVGGRCEGCHIQLSAVAVDRIAKTPADQPVICEECGRLLVR